MIITVGDKQFQIWVNPESGDVRVMMRQDDCDSVFLFDQEQVEAMQLLFNRRGNDDSTVTR